MNKVLACGFEFFRRKFVPYMSMYKGLFISLNTTMVV
jgi:hypothetical protein